MGMFGGGGGAGGWSQGIGGGGGGMQLRTRGADSWDEDYLGKVYDADRVMYLRNYLTHLQRATREGLPVKGYFLWSLMDNFEWEDGYTKLFGIHHVDFATQKRTPKMSADWYRELIRTNRLV